MIAKDQPTIFDSSVVVAVSSEDDGTMKLGAGQDEEGMLHRRQFLDKIGISLDQSTPLSLTYDRPDYASYKVVSVDEKGKSMRRLEPMPVADALVATSPGHALFLSLADCCALVLHDPVRHILMLSHIGRHSAEVDGASRSVAFLQENFGCNPTDIMAWLGPAVGSATYPIMKKDGKSLHAVIADQLHAAGVTARNIEICNVDTAVDQNYFSHSEFKKGHRTTDGRFAVVAMMTERGETAS